MCRGRGGAEKDPYISANSSAPTSPCVGTTIKTWHRNLATWLISTIIQISSPALRALLVTRDRPATNQRPGFPTPPPPPNEWGPRPGLDQWEARIAVGLANRRQGWAGYCLIPMEGSWGLLVGAWGPLPRPFWGWGGISHGVFWFQTKNILGDQT